MGLVVIVSPLYGAEQGLGEGYIGLVLGGNSLIVAALAVPVATRIEPRGPFRMLGASAVLVAAGLACYGAIPSPALALLAGLTRLPADPAWKESFIGPSLARAATYLKAWLPAALAERLRYH